MREEDILCVSTHYEKKYWLNPRFEKLPKTVQDELKILCVLFTEEVGGELILHFEEGKLMLTPRHRESDFYYDPIGAGLKIKSMQTDRQELFEQLEMYHYALEELGR